MPVNTRLQVRRGAASGWIGANPILYAGEIGYETDTRRIKIGDGTTSWTSLDYSIVVPTGFIAGSGIGVSVAADGSTVTISSTNPIIETSGITDFIDAVNDRVYDLITAGSGIQLDYTDNNNDTSSLQISVTGVALNGHNHTASDITDFNSAVSGLLPTINNSGDNRVLTSTGSSTGVNAESSLTFDGTTLSISGVLDIDSIRIDNSTIRTKNGQNLVLQTSPSIDNNPVTSQIELRTEGVRCSGTTGDFYFTTENSRGLAFDTNNGTDSGYIVINDGLGGDIEIASSGNVLLNGNTILVNGIEVSVSGHAHTLSNITDVSASATEVNYLDGSIPGTGVAGKAVVLDSNLNITNLGNVSTTGTLTVGGNLIVNGSSTIINSTITTIDDPIFTLGGDTAPVGDDNKDRGIEFRYFDGSAKIGFFGYDDSSGKFIFIPNATNTSEIFSGTKGEIDANIDWSNVLNKPDPVVSVNLSGDITGSGNATLTDLTNGNISINTTIGANSVALGTDTTGNYVASISNGSYISGGDIGSEGAALTLAVDATTTNTGNKVVARDANGDFAAGIVTASGLSGVNSSNPVIISYAIIDGGTP